MEEPAMTTKTEGAVMVPMEVEYQPAWLTWVASREEGRKERGEGAGRVA